MHGWTLSIGAADADASAGSGGDSDPRSDRLVVSIAGTDGGGDRLATSGPGD